MCAVEIADSQPHTEKVLVSAPITLKTQPFAQSTVQFTLAYGEDLTTKLVQFCAAYAIEEVSTYNTVFAYVLDNIRSSVEDLRHIDITGDVHILLLVLLLVKSYC